FTTGQNPDGTWSYDYKHGGGLPEGVAMNCVGLLGMAIGHGLAQDVRERLASEGALHAAGAVAAPTVTNVPTAVYQIGQYQEEFEAKKKAAKDDRIVKGFVALNRHVGQPVGQWADRPMVNLYFLWSIERVAVLYNLATIGDKDWYRWGAEILVANQKKTGHWEGGGYHGASPTIDSCFALLFLKRANLTKELASRLPFNPESLAKDIISKLPSSQEKKEPEKEKETAQKTPEPVTTEDEGPAQGIASLPKADSKRPGQTA